MADANPIYDLVLLLDTGAPEEQRTKILGDAEALITKQGEVVSKHDWGPRPTAYEVRKKKDADYHLIQFHGTPELIATLDRTLRITDGVQRFRIIKLHAGVGTPPDLSARPQAAEAAEQAPAEPAPAA
jgi:small subunit ribosomal protein S6